LPSDSRVLRIADTLRDLSHAARTLLRQPSFAIAAVVSLALGIGPTVAVFSVLDAALLNPLPYAEPERLITIRGTSPTTTSNPLSYPNYLEMRSRVRTLDDIAAWFLEMFTLTGRVQAERVIGGRVSASYFSVLRTQPLLGRTFTATEDRIGGPPVVLLGESLWRRVFGADPQVVGQTVTLDGKPHTVIGVMPAHVGVGVIPRLYNDVFLPIGQYDDPLFLSRHVNAINAIGRLGPSGLAEARADLETIASALAAAYPEANKGVGVNVLPLEDDLVGDLRPTLTLLAASVAFVLLIACANVSNLSLARFTGRSHEFALRSALGASRLRLFRQTLLESLCLAVVGGTVGVALAVWGTRAALSVLPSALPDMVNVGLNVRVLLVASAATGATALVCAIVPSLRAWRQDAGQQLTQMGRSGGSRRHRAQHLFLVTQVALTFTLLVGASLMGRSLARLWRVDPGFDPRGVVTVMTGLPDERAKDAARVRLAFRQVAEQVAKVPGVQAASTVFGALPYTGNNNAVDFWRAGEPRPEGSDARLALFSAVGPDYFRTLGIPLLKGRGFATDDRVNSPPVTIVDEAFARSVFPELDPIGQRVHLDSFEDPLEVIGVAGPVKHWGLDPERSTGARLQVYVPNEQLPDGLAPLATRGFSIVVRSSRPPAEMLGSLRAALRAFDSGQVMNNERAMEDGISRSLASRRFSLVMIGLFALLALALSAVGIYGLASYLAHERTTEMGVRIALGAQRRDILQALLGSVGQVAALGITLGLVAALGLAHLIAGMLFGISPTDPVTLAGVAAVFVSVMLAASYLPARRALAVDPVVALRRE
jgi:predicted permease